MTGPLHSAQDASDGIHILNHFEFADVAARTALNDTNRGTVTLATTDIGKVARQTDDDSFYVLIDNSPVTWSSLTTATGTSGGDLSGTYPNPSVSALTETSGPTSLTIGAVADGNVLTRSGSTIIGAAAGFNPGRAVIVAKSGGSTDNIFAGLVSAAALNPTPSIINPATVFVYPGTYIEQPMSMQPGVSVISAGGSLSTVIETTDVFSSIIDGYAGATFSGFTLRGANSDGYGIRFDGYGATSTGTFKVSDIRIENCSTALHVDGSNTTIEINDCFIQRKTGETLETGFYSTGQGKFIGHNIHIHGVSSSERISFGVVTDGYGTNSHLTTIHMQDIHTGLYARNGSSLHVYSPCELTNGVIGARARDASELHASALNFEGTWESYHIWAETADAVLKIVSGIARHDKILLHPNSDVIMSITSDVAGDKALQIVGELLVGTEVQPKESVFGGGDSHTRNMVVLLNDNAAAGNWYNITSSVDTIDGYSQDVLLGEAVANTIYVGADYRFPGLKIKTTSAVVADGGALIAEFWNGSAWTEFNFMSTGSNAPYTQYGQTPIERVSSEQLRFGVTTDWTLTTLNSISKYWARYRVTTKITSIGQVEQFKLHTSRTEINADGFLEFFGAGRPSKHMVWHRTLLDPISGNTPGSQNINVSANIVLGATLNKLTNNAIDAKGALVIIPEGLDTSIPLTLNLQWFSDATAGNVELEVNYTSVSTGDVLNGTASETSLAAIVAVPGVAETLVKTSFAIPIQTLVPDDFIAIRIFRDATGGNADDTAAGYVTLVDTHLKGIFWR